MSAKAWSSPVEFLSNLSLNAPLASDQLPQKMSLRRQVHANNSAGMTTPRRVLADVSMNTPSTPRSPLSNSSPMSPGGSIFGTPSPRKVQMQVPPSPYNSESLSATRPFDWDAVRQHKPPPYGSPLSSARAKKARLSEMRSDSDTRRAVRKKTWREKYVNATHYRLSFYRVLTLRYPLESWPCQTESYLKSPSFLIIFRPQSQKQALGSLAG